MKWILFYKTIAIVLFVLGAISLFESRLQEGMMFFLLGDSQANKATEKEKEWL